MVNLLGASSFLSLYVRSLGLGNFCLTWKGSWPRGYLIKFATWFPGHSLFRDNDLVGLFEDVEYSVPSLAG